MKYLCLVYLEQQKLHAVEDTECFSCGQRLRANGSLIAAEAPLESESCVPCRMARKGM